MEDDYDELFTKFESQASRLELVGDKRVDYIKQCFERLERQREREAKQKEKELEENAKVEIERENAKVEIERENAKVKIEIEREKTKQLEAQAQRPESSIRDRTSYSAGPKPVYPKLPMFREKQDDIDSFIYRFEAHAVALKWDQSQWVIYLSALLEGNALSLYHSLAANSDGSVSYECLKDNLLKKFQCTADGFRKRFQEVRPDTNEPFQTFGIELTRLLDRWIALSGTARTKEGMMDLILCEQFLESVSNDLATFIREKNLSKLDDMVKAAESYRLARPGKSLARKSSSTVFASVADAEDNHATGAGFSDQQVS